jgi:hypothetical protein
LPDPASAERQLWRGLARGRVDECQDREVPFAEDSEPSEPRLYDYWQPSISEAPDVLGAFLVGWLAPRRRLSRKVVVPEFVGQRVSQLWHVAAKAGVKLDIKRRTEHPPPVDGLVVEQSPAPGTVVRRNTAVHLAVVHEVEPT